ncbi:MAG: hypothetical protein U1D67_08090 [Dehalococcoidia bacterium]|nr:hypothetical protein [Dehalococcoidia bacterium]
MTIAAASPPSPVPGGVVTVANIEVLAEKAGKYTADVSVEKLEGAGGVPIVPKVIQGQVWVFPPATIEGPATSITEGEYAAVPIQLKNVSSILGLGAYELELNYDPKAIKVHRVTDWPMPDKSYVQASSEISDGLITASGTINRKPGPVGNVSLLELIIQGLQAGRYPIDITVKRLTDTDDRPIEAAPSPAIVTISPFTTVVIGSVSLQVGKAGRVPVAIRNYADQAGLGSANLEIGYPRQMMEFISVEKGDVDLADISQVQPPEQDNAIGRILFSTAPAAGLGSRDEIVLAYIKLMPLAEGEITLTLRAGRLLNSAGQPQAARGIQGVITAGSPFKISQLAVSPRYPVIKDSFKITAVISNAGNAAAVYPVRLWIDGVMEKSGSVELGAGETKNMSFDVTREKPGMFKANFGGKDFLFNVVDPADLTLAALKVNTGRPGGTTAVSATVENNGDVEALYLAVLKLNRAEFDSKEVALKPGEKREIVFPLANLPSGSYSVDLNGLSDSFSVTSSSGQIFSLTMFLGIFAALEAVFIIILIYKSGWWKKKEATG